MPETQNPSSVESQARKLRSLVAMFSICPKASTDESAAEIYLRLSEDIPADLFEAAVYQILGTWSWPHPPMPAEIRAAARKLSRKRRKAVRRAQLEAREAQAQLATEASTLTPEQANSRLAEVRASLSVVGKSPRGEESSLADVLGKGSA
jgi:hypothetical protein